MSRDSILSYKIHEAIKEEISIQSMYHKEMSINGYSVIYYVSNVTCVYESSERTVITSGTFRILPNGMLDKSLEEITADSDYQGIMFIINKRSKEIYAIQGPCVYQPIFYTAQNDLILMSNDINIIAKIYQRIKEFKPIINILALYEIILLDEIISTHTIFKGIEHVRAGEYIHITIKKEGLGIKHVRYWKPWEINKYYNENAINLHEISHNLIQTLIKAIEEYCKESKGIIGIPLSGGLDSAMIITLVRKICKDELLVPVHVNLGIKDEIKLSKKVCKINNINCFYVSYPITKVLKKYETLLRKHLCCIQYPRPGDAAFPYFLLAETFKDKGIKFVISGDDGDCMWGGYDLFIYYCLQLLFENKFKEFMQLVMIFHRYKQIDVVKLIIGVFSTLVKIKFPGIFFKGKIKNVIKFSYQNKKLHKLLVQYISALYDCTLRPKSTSLFKEYLARRFVYFSSILINTNIKAHECHDVTLIPLFASRKLLETMLSIPEEFFFTPYGIRSLQRLILRLFGYPPSIYLQKKSGFSLTEYVIHNPKIILTMKELLKSDHHINKFIELKKLKVSDLLKVFNFKLKYDSLIVGQ